MQTISAVMNTTQALRRRSTVMVIAVHRGAELLKAARGSQGAKARRLGVSQAYVSQLSAGKRARADHRPVRKTEKKGARRDRANRALRPALPSVQELAPVSEKVMG